MLKLILHNFKNLVLAQVVSQVFGFFTVVYLARTMGVNGFGIIVFAQTLISYFYIVSDLGTTRLGTREVARDHNIIATYAGSVISIRIVLTLFAFLLVLLCLVYSDRACIDKFVIVMFGVSLFANTIFVDWVFKGLDKMQYVAIANIVERISYFVLVMTLVNKSSNILIIPIIFFVGNILASAYLLYIMVYRLAIRLRLTCDYRIWRNILYLALPMAFSNVMVRINNNMDTLLLGILKDDAIVGYYNAAYKIILVAFLVGGFYVTAVFPSASRLFRHSLDDLRKLLSNSVRILMLLGIPIAFGGISLAKQIITSIYGEGYIASVDAFQVLCIYIPISFLTMIYADTLIACDMQKDYAVGMAISAAINILLNLVLIPSYGMVGAATATVMSEMTLFLYSFWRLKKVVHVGFIKQLIIPIISSILMCIVLFCVHCSVFAMIVLGASTYLLVSVLLGGVKLAEISLIKSLVFK